MTARSSTPSTMPNRLADETSPYLRQHADNPVDWYPWGTEALDAAKSEGKPILLSVGYASCHWCHVMAHESFEDANTAAVMNQLFVCIKVDREERPDVDKIYQLAHQLLTQQGGGWPLTIFLDPNTMLPFFSGTYFPKSARYQLPGFSDLMMRINEVWTQRRDELTEQGGKLASVFAQLVPATPKDARLPTPKALGKGRDALANMYDPKDGGFGSAPKFPMPHAIERLLRHSAFQQREGHRERETLDMAMSTLTQMARGGIYDHVGGGFCRYSVDSRWMIPHFEKMLYDNAALLSVYAQALAMGPDALFEGVVRETAGWVMREMQHPRGGYFSSLDADSEGEEGKFYVWRRPELKQLLDDDEYLVVETLYGLDKPANFEGKWNLHRYDAWHAVAQRLSLQRDTADALLASAKQKMFAYRAQRVRPALDDKVLTSWNGLMIKGMAAAGWKLNEDLWIDSACQAVDFIREHLWRDGRLLATWKDDQARHPAYLDDYAFLLDGLLTLLQVRWRHEDLAFAVALADAALEHFEDRENGGFFFTAHDHEQLIHRSKVAGDDATQPGNAVLAAALITLGNLMGDARYIEGAERTLKWCSQIVSEHPAAHCGMLSALELLHYPPTQVLVHGPAAQIGEWQSALADGYRPWRNTFAIPNDVGPPPRVTPPYLPKLVSATDRQRPVAYVCAGLSCSLPIRELDALQAELKANA